MLYLHPMRDIDLGPNDYRIRGARQAHDAPEGRRLAMFGFFAALCIVAFIFLNRDELTSGTLFGVSCMFSFAGGLLFADWVKRH